MLVVKNDPAVQAAVTKVEELLETLERNKNLHLLKKFPPRIVITRWNTYSLHLDVAVEEFSELLVPKPNQTEDFDDFDHDDVGVIRKGALILAPLKHLSDIAQSNRANFFDCLAITGRLRALCSKFPNNPEKTKVLREAIVVPEHVGLRGRKVPLFNRWTWLCNDIVTVLAALCPHAMVAQEKTLGGDQNVIRFSHFAMDRLGKWFNPKIANDYFDLCISGGDILVSIDAKLTFVDDEAASATAVDCLSFWSKLGQKYSDFSELAACVVQLFTLPSTEADLERVFSLMKNIVTDKRKSLAPRNLEACILVHALYDNFAAEGRPTFRRHADRLTDHVPNVSRGACLAVLAFNECLCHNALCAAGAIADKYKVDEVQAFLFTNTNQAHFIDGQVKIMIDRNQVNAARVDRVPLQLIHFKAGIKKSTKKEKTNEEDQRVSCGACNRLLSDHQDIVDGIDETIQCASCNKWIHYSCSRVAHHAWAEIVRRANDNDTPWNCAQCRADKRSQAIDARRRARQELNVDDE